MPRRRAHSIQPSQLRQRGAAFMIMLIILIIGAVTIFVSMLNSSTLQLARDQTTTNALAQAKEALIGYAASSPTRPGELPCPDTNNDGLQDACTSPNLVGWLPWKTLGLPELRDANGDHLWYAVADSFRTNSTATLNSDTPTNYPTTMLSVKDGVTSTQIENNIVAIIFSPGVSLAGQTRNASDNNATTALSNYLDGENNNLDTVYQTANDKVTPLPTPTVNDRLLTIGRDSLLPTVETRVAREAKNCLDAYAASSSGKYPWAAPVADSTYTSSPGTYFGRIPTSPSSSGGSTNSTITALLAMQSQLALVQTALNTYAATPNSTTASALSAAAQTLINMTNNSLTSSVNNTVDNAGDAARALANGSGGTVSSVNTSIANANSAINTALTNAGYTASDPSMLTSWATIPACTALFAYMPNWQSEVFYQVADGYQPGSSAAFGTPLSINGSGTYRAVVIVARRAIGTENRSNPYVNPPSPYLEGINPHNPGSVGSPPSPTFETYNPNDATNFANVNDLVLCLDGKVNCI